MTDYRTWGDKLGHSLFHWTASAAEFRGAEIYLQNPREAEANDFRRRFAEEVAARGTSVFDMTAEDGAALSERIRDEILAGRAI